MAQVRLHVELLEVSQNAVALIYAACRQCYSAKFAGDIFLEQEKEPGKQEAFIRKVVASGHESPLEHVKFTFAIEGVSRALTHQLVRHRIASYSQQSQRYVKATDFNYIMPPSIERDEALKKRFLGVMAYLQEQYDQMIESFKKDDQSGESVNQDVRFILPQAAETKIVVTMNCRELLHFFCQRCCSRAQWEIRALAERMLALCKEKLPAVFSDAGAICERLRYCPESRQFSCGRYPVKEDLIKE